MQIISVDTPSNSEKPDFVFVLPWKEEITKNKIKNLTALNSNELHLDSSYIFQPGCLTNKLLFIRFSPRLFII